MALAMDAQRFAGAPVLRNAGGIGASASELWGPMCSRSILVRPPQQQRHRQRGPPRIEMAVNRKKKEETVAKVKQELEKSCMVAALRYKGFTNDQLAELRETLPDNTRLFVAKNTLVEKAIQGTKWETLKPALNGMNAWLFVHTEEIPAAIKPYRTFQKEKKVDNDFAGAVFEGKFYSPEEFNQLETLPTRAEIYAKLLGMLKAPSSKVVGALQAPARKLLLTLKAHVEKLEAAAKS